MTRPEPPAIFAAHVPASGKGGSFERLLEAVEAKRDQIASSLIQQGAVLFRGYGVATAEQFGTLVQALFSGRALGDYAGGASPRTMIESGSRPIYNSTDYPPHMTLPLHNELSYTDRYPAHIAFCCLVAPDKGGATTLGDSRLILAAMPAALRRKFEAKGVCYIRTLSPDEHSPYGWPQDGFHPSALDPISYEELMRMCGSEDRFRLNVTYGDGEAIPIADLQAIRAVLRAQERAHCWRAGDVLVLDNLLTAHGRAPFEGRRSIAVAMA
jgi:alpha-ketoglutarate-dependent taurine dioxygenase